MVCAGASTPARVKTALTPSTRHREDPDRVPRVFKNGTNAKKRPCSSAEDGGEPGLPAGIKLIKTFDDKTTTFEVIRHGKAVTIIGFEPTDGVTSPIDM